MPPSTILQLARLIHESVVALEQTCLQAHTSVPDLDVFEFDHSSEAFRDMPVAAEMAKIAVSACMQLSAILLPPTDTVYRLALGGHLSFAMRTCLEANVTEILREAGPNGLHVNEIAVKCGLDPSKLGRIIRYLVIHHVYRELKPDVFANNRISATLDTGKNAKDNFADPDSKYDSTGFPALVSHLTDVDHKCSAAAWDVLKDPVLGHSNDITDTIFSRALRTNTTYWGFFEHPDNKFRSRRFGYAMKGMGAMQSADAIFKAFNWEALPKDSLIVDVGGGIGASIMPLAQKYLSFNIVVQDLPMVVDEGLKFWSHSFPEALISGRVKIESQSFFDVQPIKNASVFFLKYVLHDWPKSYIIKILKRLRDVATKNTTLVIIDNVLPYACRQGGETGDSLAAESAFYKEAPIPLLPNYGAVGHSAYTLDLTMMFHYNAQEHTVLGIKDLLTASGWRFLKFRSVNPKNDFLQSIEAVAF